MLSCSISQPSAVQYLYCLYLVILVTVGRVTVKDEEDVTKIFELQQHLAIVTEVKLKYVQQGTMYSTVL